MVALVGQRFQIAGHPRGKDDLTRIVLQTFPLIGNYGVIPSDFESAQIGPAAYIVKHPCQAPSNFRSEGSLDTFLKRRGIIGLCGIDTRALARVIRENGVMNGRIMGTEPDKADILEIRSYIIQNFVPKVSATEMKLYKADAPLYTVALFDFGSEIGLDNLDLPRLAVKNDEEIRELLNTVTDERLFVLYAY